jgi:L-histidine Nalpha-methyltransferase / hercynylcysteine S-oxide synthase
MIPKEVNDFSFLVYFSPCIVKTYILYSCLVTRDFILNGLDHVDRILGGSTGLARDDNVYEYVSIYNEVLGRHEAYYRVLEPKLLSLPDGSSVQLEKNELVHVEYSVKYDAAEVRELCDGAGLYTPVVSCYLYEI